MSRRHNRKRSQERKERLRADSANRDLVREMTPVETNGVHTPHKVWGFRGGTTLAMDLLPVEIPFDPKDPEEPGALVPSALSMLLGGNRSAGSS